MKKRSVRLEEDQSCMYIFMSKLISDFTSTYKTLEETMMAHNANHLSYE